VHLLHLKKTNHEHKIPVTATATATATTMKSNRETSSLVILRSSGGGGIEGVDPSLGIFDSFQRLDSSSSSSGLSMIDNSLALSSNSASSIITGVAVPAVLAILVAILLIVAAPTVIGTIYSLLTEGIDNRPLEEIQKEAEEEKVAAEMLRQKIEAIERMEERWQQSQYAVSHKKAVAVVDEEETALSFQSDTTTVQQPQKTTSTTTVISNSSSSSSRDDD